MLSRNPLFGTCARVGGFFIALFLAVMPQMADAAAISSGTFCVGMHSHRLYNGGGSPIPTYHYSVFRNWDTVGTKDWEIWKGPGAADIDWTTIEAVYKGHYAAGARTLKVFSGVPTWISRRPGEADNKYSTPGRKAGPKDLVLYENYVYEFVKHMNQYLWAVEGENEPNPEFSSMSMTELADSQKAVYNGTKRANPSMPVFSPAQSYLDNYLSEVMAAKTSAGEPIWQFFDAVAVHPYNSSGAGGPGTSLADEIANVRSRMTAAGVPTTMPILDSEHGWGDWGPNISGMSEDQQGQVVYNTVKMAKELGLVGIMLYSHDNEYPYIGQPMNSAVVSQWLEKAYADFDTCGAATATTVATTATTTATTAAATTTAVTTTAAAGVITAAELATHNTQANCWVGYAGKVYDLSAFLPSHPGTAAAIAPYCGKAAGFEAMLNAQHGAANAAAMLTQFGVLKGNLATTTTATSATATGVTATATATATPTTLPPDPAAPTGDPTVTTTAAATVSTTASTITAAAATGMPSTGAATVGAYTAGPVPVAAPSSPRSAYDVIYGLSYNDANGIRNGNDHTGYFDNRDWIMYKSIDFGTTGPKSVTFEVAENPEYAGGTIEIHMDSVSGTKIGSLVVSSTGGWYTFNLQSTTVSKTTGVHDVYLVARGGWGVANIRAFVFVAASAADQVCAIPTGSITSTAVAASTTATVGTTGATGASGANYGGTTGNTGAATAGSAANGINGGAGGAGGAATGAAASTTTTAAASTTGISPAGICGLTPVYIAPATGNWLADWNNGPVYGWPPGTKAENTTMITLPSGETAVSIGMKKEADGVVSVGAINSQGKFHVDGPLGGYFEFQAKWSLQGGPSGWLLSEDYEPGGHLDRWEIDVIERFLPDGWQGGGYNIMHSTGHSPDRMDGSDIDTGTNLSSDFHTYAVDWYPGKYIRWYFDGKMVKEITDGGLIAAGGEPFQTVFNTAIGESDNNTVQGLFGDPANVGTTNDPTLIKGVKMYNRTSETGGICAGATTAATGTTATGATAAGSVTTGAATAATGSTAATGATTTTTTAAGTAATGAVATGSTVAVGAGIPTPGSLTGLTASGPLEVGSGQTITGLKISNPNGPCITVNGSNVKITGNEIGPCRGGIYINGGSNITVDHNYIHDTTTWNAAQEADFDGPAIQSNGSNNVTVAYNYIENVTTGYYAVGGGGIVMDHNYVKNVHGSPRSRGNIDRIGGQMAQYNGVDDAGSRITCNVSDQIPGQAWTEDHINTWTSKGKASDPLLIAYNKIRGYGPSMSNGGIIAGDGASQYIVIRNNNVIDAGGYGVAIAGGSNNTVTQNKIVGDCPRCGKGMYVHDYSGGGCTDNEMSYNRVRYRGAPGEGTDWGAESLCPNTRGVETNILNDQTLDAAAMWAEVFPEC